MKLRNRATGVEESLDRCQDDACELCRFEFPEFLIIMDDGELERWHIIPQEESHAPQE